MTQGYAFRQADCMKNRQSPLRKKYIFTFKSTKDSTIYIVNVDEYDFHVYIVKFYRKKDRLSKNKFNLLSRSNDARKIIYTCIDIGKEIAGKNELASFGFIGAPTPEEKEQKNIKKTKRFRVYDKYAAFYFNPNNYIHLRNEQYSSYLLINKSHCDQCPTLEADIEQMFKSNFDIESIFQ